MVLVLQTEVPSVIYQEAPLPYYLQGSPFVAPNWISPYALEFYSIGKQNQK